MRRATMVAALAAMVGIAGRAEAGLIITFSEVGSDVFVVGSGTLVTAGLGTAGSIAVRPSYDAAMPSARLGPSGITLADFYRPTFTGPASFGTGNGGASEGSGDVFGFHATRSLLYVPLGYVSGSQLFASSTYQNQTFNSLGLTAGTYVYSYAAGQGGDTITVQVGATAAPEPSTLAGADLGLALAAGAVLRRRRKVAAA